MKRGFNGFQLLFMILWEENANQLPTSTLYSCTGVKIHSFNVPLQGFCVNSNSFLEITTLCFEQEKRFNIHRHISTWSDFILAGD